MQHSTEIAADQKIIGSSSSTCGAKLPASLSIHNVSVRHRLQLGLPILSDDYLLQHFKQGSTVRTVTRAHSAG